jgi:DNA-binding winged helix-turn-helix (wHTH) protein
MCRAMQECGQVQYCRQAQRWQRQGIARNGFAPATGRPASRGGRSQASRIASRCVDRAITGPPRAGHPRPGTRRHGPNGRIPVIRLGEIEIDIVNRQVRAGDSVVHLSGIEQSLLYLLASRGGRVVSREEILDTIWGVDFVAESNIVDRHIRSLRIRLQDDYRHPRFIATVPGEGYRFIPTFSNTGWIGGPVGSEHSRN